MKAAQISEYGDASVVQINEVDKPSAKPGQVVIEVHATSINPFDTMVRSGYLQESIPLELPVTLGGDVAGVISEIASDVTSLKVGDKVYGQANVVAGNSGAFAEFAATAAGQVSLMPSNVDFADAAALPLVGVSAWQALVQHIKLKSGQKIFIHGGAGGIGTVAIQIAKHLGAYVATSATGEGIAYTEKLGTDEVIDYKSQDFREALRDYDAVFDTVGHDEFSKALTILKPGGTGVSMIDQADDAQTNQLGVTAVTQSTHVTTEALDALRDLIEAGAVSPHVHKTFPLDQIKEAFTLRETGSVIGKLVIKVK